MSYLSIFGQPEGEVESLAIHLSFVIGDASDRLAHSLQAAPATSSLER